VADPWLVGHGIVGGSAGEIGLIEHVGRRSGTVRVSPVHPVPTERGFRIVVPLGLESRWARNVLAAGHCRLQVGDTVYELDEPALVPPSAIEGVPALARRVMDWLGFRYLVLHRLTEAPGTLASVTRPNPEWARPEPVTASRGGDGEVALPARVTV
jgi:deazaflavin-dependent oxidoreductase (nitroreductase family)